MMQLKERSIHGFDRSFCSPLRHVANTSSQTSRWSFGSIVIHAIARR
ncbi:MAG: hypothetical protein NT070_09335 [Cyanobacteria bacterium]|nr:hypothetical protein [Cyanobacteriota bacterium]